jgi:serine/threonine protein kinase
VSAFSYVACVYIEGLERELEKTTLRDLEFVKKNGGLGKGAYGEVEMAVHKKTGIKLAIKKIDKRSIANKKIKATLMREVDIHKQLKHENIIRLYTSFEDTEYIYLVLEFAEKGNLFYYIRNGKRRLNEEESFHYFI